MIGEHTVVRDPKAGWVRVVGREGRQGMSFEDKWVGVVKRVELGRPESPEEIFQWISLKMR